jgi:GR25 family glycosyltransferase involved in LPS biosynthesis
MPVPLPADLYVVHHPRLDERRRDCESALDALGWTATWIDQPLATGLSLWLARVRNPRLTRGQLDTYLRHELVLRRVGAGTRDAFVLEDDPLFPEGFEAAFPACLAELPARWDMAFFGASSGLETAPERPGARLGRATATRSMSAYLVSPEAARSLARGLEARAITLPIDLTLNALLQERAMDVFWSVPALVANGSEQGRYPRAVVRRGLL